MHTLGPGWSCACVWMYGMHITNLLQVLTLCSSLWKLAAKAIWNWLQCRISDSSEPEQLFGLFIPAMGMEWLFGW